MTQRRPITVRVDVALEATDEHLTGDSIAAALEEEIGMLVPSVAVHGTDGWMRATVTRVAVQRVDEGAPA